MIGQEQKTLYYNLYKNDTVKKTNLFTNVIVCNVSVCDFCREGSGLEMTGVLLLCLTQSKSPRPDRLSSTWRMSWTLRCRLSTERSEIELYIMIIRQYFVCLCAGFFRPVIDSWLTKCSYSDRNYLFHEGSIIATLNWFLRTFFFLTLLEVCIIILCWIATFKQ